MKNLLTTNKYVLDRYVLCRAERCGQSAARAARGLRYGRDAAAPAMAEALELRYLILWFSDDRKAILESARKGVRYMRDLFAQLDSEKKAAA